MNLRTKLDDIPSHTKITYDSSICMLGSCFSASIGGKLLRYKHNVLKNPFGTLYHPSTIRRNLDTQENHSYNKKDNIIKLDNRYVHYDTHSDIYAGDSDAIVSLLAQKKHEVQDFLTQADFIFLTLGSAWHFYHKHLNRIVANCHKQPSDLFERRLSSVADVIIDLNVIVKTLKALNADANIIFTVSPVRHIRDGLVDNNRSKSHLLTAVHHICDIYPEVQYFPAYELIIDDLRDYRFYKSDMIHPTEQAIDYVWGKLRATFMTSDTNIVADKIEKILKSLEHRPIDHTSEQHQSFLQQLRTSIETLTADRPLDFTEELAHIDQYIS